MSHYRVHVFACQNQRAPDAPRPSCGLARGEEIRIAFQQAMRRHGLTDVRANKAGCLERCELGPCVVVYPEGVWYRIEDVAADVEEIVSEHFVKGQVVTRLALPSREAP